VKILVLPGDGIAPEVVVQACDAVLLGAVGWPKWDDPRATVRPEQALLGLPKGLGLFTNLRPVTVHPQLGAVVRISPSRPSQLPAAKPMEPRARSPERGPSALFSRTASGFCAPCSVFGAVFREVPNLPCANQAIP
jgi:hypothetical protein